MGIYGQNTGFKVTLTPTPVITANTFMTWGLNYGGGLGDGTSAQSKSTPIQIGALTN